MPRSRYRSRSREYPYPEYPWRDWGPWVTTPGVVVEGGTQITVSEGHRWPPPKGSTGDVGGDFFTTKQYIANYPKVAGYGTTYYGNPDYPATQIEAQFPLLPINPNSSEYPRWGVSLHSKDSTLDEKGATAVARCKPTNSVADLSTFLGETIKDGLPKLAGAALWKEKTKLAKGAGSEYLNLQFGWQPLVNDVRSISRAITHANTVLAQYERDAGKLVRRSFHFPSETKRDVVSLGDKMPWAANIGTSFLESPFVGSLYRTTESVRDVWFSGAFTYTIPSGSETRSEMDRIAALADKLFGIDITPEVLWNLAPWSWAVDWFSNAGDVLSNVSDTITDGLVMHHGYIMEHSFNKVTYDMTGLRHQNGSPVSVPSLSFVTETKVRRAANPFGFGVKWEGLSPFQLSIAAALGLTKGSR